jgi:hypothetical protein
MTVSQYRRRWNLATSLIISASLLQVVNCLFQVDNLGQAVRTQLVDGLLADLLQDVRFLRVCDGQRRPLVSLRGIQVGTYASLVVINNVSELSGQRLRISKCRHGYEGKLCEIDIDWCDVIRNNGSLPCDYGICQDGLFNYTLNTSAIKMKMNVISMPSRILLSVFRRQIQPTLESIKSERYGLLKDCLFSVFFLGLVFRQKCGPCSSCVHVLCFCPTIYYI